MRARHRYCHVLTDHGSHRPGELPGVVGQGVPWGTEERRTRSLTHTNGDQNFHGRSTGSSQDLTPWRCTVSNDPSPQERRHWDSTSSGTIVPLPGQCQKKPRVRVTVSGRRSSRGARPRTQCVRRWRCVNQVMNRNPRGPPATLTRMLPSSAGEEGTKRRLVPQHATALARIHVPRVTWQGVWNVPSPAPEQLISLGTTFPWSSSAVGPSLTSQESSAERPCPGSGRREAGKRVNPDLSTLSPGTQPGAKDTANTPSKVSPPPMPRGLLTSDTHRGVHPPSWGDPGTPMPAGTAPAG